MKALLLSATLLSFAVGTVGCNTGKPFGMSSVHAPGLSFDTSHPVAISKTASHQPAILETAHESPIQFTQDQSANTAANQYTQAAYYQTPQQVDDGRAADPLVTLGPNENLHEIVNNSTGVVMVDFYADWCGPCRKQGGILHDMEHSASQNHASIIKVNIDHHPQLASEFEVSSLPTLILIKNGKIIERQKGVADHRRVAALLAR